MSLIPCPPHLPVFLHKTYREKLKKLIRTLKHSSFGSWSNHLRRSLCVERQFPRSTRLRACTPEEAAAHCAWRWTNGRLSPLSRLWADCQGHVMLRVTFDPSVGRFWFPPDCHADNFGQAPSERTHSSKQAGLPPQGVNFKIWNLWRS